MVGDQAVRERCAQALAGVKFRVGIQKSALDPDSGWIPTDKQTHNRNGYRGKWYTPGWPWPFKDGVGVVVGNCSYPHGATARAAQPAECCSVIFGVIKGAKCFETAHHMVLEQALEARRAEPPASVAATPLNGTPSAAASARTSPLIVVVRRMSTAAISASVRALSDMFYAAGMYGI